MQEAFPVGSNSMELVRLRIQEFQAARQPPADRCLRTGLFRSQAVSDDDEKINRM